jgi:predicted transcriptional regulator
MNETTFTFRIDESLKNAFGRAARANDQTAAQVLRAAMRDYVARNARDQSYDGWLAEKVARARASMGDGRGVTHDIMSARFAMIRTDARLSQ